MPEDRDDERPDDAVDDTPPVATEKPRRKRRQRAARQPDAPAPEAPPAPELPEDQVIVLAVRGMLLFPGVVLPVVVGRPQSVAAIQAAVQAERPIALLLQKDPELETPRPKDLHQVGTLADVVRYVTAPDGTHHVIAQGLERFRVKRFTQTDPYLIAEIDRLPEPEVPDSQQKALEAELLTLRTLALEAVELLPQKPEELEAAIQGARDPGGLTDMVATFIDIPPNEKQELLETTDLLARMRLVAEKLGHLIEVLSLSKEIRKKTKGSMEKAQREYFLREQLKAIRAELGEGGTGELEELREQIAEAGMPDEARTEAEKELRRLERMPEAAMEHGMIRSYLDTLIELPWSKGTQDAIDLEESRRILDEDHYGLEKIKQRILEFLAVRKLKPEGKSPILCLVGPPGVGKTSLGQSIARAMGREFVRVSLGGVHDEAEIRGHRRTYVGAMTGNIITGIRKARSNNPVFMLDEMDKLGQGFHGDPSSALLEVLDPAQNKTFRDHYLGVPFDLSRVMFVATANVLDQIPGPLRDRMEVIELPGYTEEEKLEIAKRYLVKRQTEANGLQRKQLRIDVGALREIVRHYTREAGVRNLERQIGAVARRAATRVAGGEAEVVRVRAADLPEILGPPRFEDEVKSRTSLPGVATGLAWTPMGGDILFIEAQRMPGKGELIVTGQLGDVMKESVRAALSLVKARADELGIAREAFDACDLHLHFPAGAIPKDGPSAGVTIFTALVSLLTGRKCDSNVAMTGEISLRGLVLPVGGIKEKVLAAYRAGIRKVLLPARNQKDEEEIPEAARRKIEIVYLEQVDEALEHALAKHPVPGFRASC